MSFVASRGLYPCLSGMPRQLGAATRMFLVRVQNAHQDILVPETFTVALALGKYWTPRAPQKHSQACLCSRLKAAIRQGGVWGFTACGLRCWPETFRLSHPRSRQRLQRLVRLEFLLHMASRTPRSHKAIHTLIPDTETIIASP